MDRDLPIVSTSPLQRVALKLVVHSAAERFGWQPSRLNRTRLCSTGVPFHNYAQVESSNGYKQQTTVSHSKILWWEKMIPFECFICHEIGEAPFFHFDLWHSVAMCHISYEFQGWMKPHDFLDSCFNHQNLVKNRGSGKSAFWPGKSAFWSGKSAVSKRCFFQTSNKHPKKTHHVVLHSPFSLLATGSSISPIVDGNKLRNFGGHLRLLQPLRYWMVPSNSAVPHEVHCCSASRSSRGACSSTSAVQTG